MKYELLEPGLAESIGGTSVSFDTTQPVSFFASTSFIYTLAFVVIIVAASFRYAYAGTLRLPGSEEGIRKSKEEFRRVTYGLLGVLGLWLILATVNRDMLTGNVSLRALKLESITSGQGSIVTPSGTSASCNNAEQIKTTLNNGGGICGNTNCSLTSCLTNNRYTDMVKRISGAARVDWKMTLVLLCKESSGNKDAKNVNPDGTYDCGLMQVNQRTHCTQAVLDPESNITAGVAKLREKMGSTSNGAVYPSLKVKPETALFTAYNCCSNGTIPNEQSASCKTEDGWPSIPKWACPIDPGEGKFNMCSVKAYACDLTVCLDSL